MNSTKIVRFSVQFNFFLPRFANETQSCIEAPVTNELAVAANNAVKYIHTMYLRANDINGQHLKSDLVIMNGRLHLFITSQVTTRLGSNLRLHKLIIINVT